MTQDAITNFHTHTALCMHATGTPYDYVRVAAASGCTALGFSDHCPYPNDGGTHLCAPSLWCDMRMSYDDAPAYINDIREAAQKVSFSVYAGFECEWDDALSSWYSDTLLHSLGADYLILGSHWVTVGSNHVYILDAPDSNTLHRYIEQTIRGIRSGLFSFIAHPDIFMGYKREWDADAIALSTALIDAAIDCNVPLEVNGLGMKKHRIMTRNGERYQYPYKEFWLLARDKGATVVCNADAHSPDCVIQDERAAHDLATSWGLAPISLVTPRPLH